MRAFTAEVDGADCYHDAVFEAGVIHGCEDDLYILWHNEDSSVPSWEWAIIDRPLIKEVWQRSEGFEDFLEDLRCSAVQYWQDSTYDFDTGEFGEDDEFYPAYLKADFIESVDGDSTAEAMYILNWAKEV